LGWKVSYTGFGEGFVLEVGVLDLIAMALIAS